MIIKTLYWLILTLIGLILSVLILLAGKIAIDHQTYCNEQQIPGFVVELDKRSYLFIYCRDN